MITASQADVREDYKKYVAKGMTLMYSPQTRESILNLLKGDDPVQRVADAVVMIMQRIDTATRKANIEVKDSIKVLAAHEFVNQVVEYGNTAGIFKLNKELAELALSVTVQDYVKSETQAGRINPKNLQVAIQADMRKMPPKERKEALASSSRIQQTARKYNHGKGMEV